MSLMNLHFVRRGSDARCASPSCLLGILIALCALTALACGDDDTETPGGPMAGNSPAVMQGNGPAATCSGKPGMLRGHSVQTLMAGGLQRRFLYYAPTTLDPNQPAPVVIVAHGYVMNGEMIQKVSGFEALAEREGFIVMFPDGQGERAAMPGMEPPWNVGQNVCQPNGFPAPIADGDDQAFIDAMLAFARADQCVDDNHVFMTGFSMGGYFANESGCTRSDLAAVAPHSAGSHDLAGCVGDVKPVMLVHFEQDALIPYTCGTEARDRWLARNGCDATAVPQTRAVMGGECAYYAGCPAGAQVAMCTFQAEMATSDELFLGHAWSGGDASDPALSPFAIPETASAAELIWAFFKEYAW